MTAHSPVPQMQRSFGEAMVSLRHDGTCSRLVDLRQQGSAKALLPHAGALPEVVFLNTSGGLTSGDRLSYQLLLGDHVHAVATTQTAERAYMANAGPARVTVSAQVGAGGWLDWLPQETILFQSSALARRTRIELAAGAGCLALESVVLGRAAMGEVVKQCALTDCRQIFRDGRPVFIEPLRLTDATLLAGNAVLGQARAFASLIMVARGAEDALSPLRQVLNEPGVEAAASAWNGKLTLRLMAADGWPLRRQIFRALNALRPAHALPRVWQL